MVGEVHEPEPEADWACAICGHGEADHEEQELDVSGGALRRTYCEVCEEWHDLVPAPEEPAET